MLNDEFSPKCWNNIHENKEIDFTILYKTKNMLLLIYNSKEEIIVSGIQIKS